jgi:hypothetical protein
VPGRMAGRCRPGAAADGRGVDYRCKCNSQEDPTRESAASTNRRSAVEILSNSMSLSPSEFRYVYGAAGAPNSTGVDPTAETANSAHLECIDHHGA